MTPTGISAQFSLSLSYMDIYPAAIITQLYVAKQTLHSVTVAVIICNFLC